MKIWTVREARAKFAELLSGAREGDPQTIRQSGLEDVVVAKVAAVPSPAYLVAALAERDAMVIALEQFQQRDLVGDRSRTPADMHMPPNNSGDVVRWVRANRGAFGAADYVVTATSAMREMQEALGLAQSTVVQVVNGLELTAGEPALFDAETRRWISSLALQTWRTAAAEVLGATWVAPDATDEQ